MIVALTLAILQALQARGRDRAYWAGFAVTGWVYFAIIFGMGAESVATPPFLTELLFNRLETLIHPETANTFAPTLTYTTTTLTPPPPPAIAITGSLTSSVSTVPTPAPAATLAPLPPPPTAPFLWMTPTNMKLIHYRQVAHSLTAVLAGIIGGWTSLWLFARRERREAQNLSDEVSPSSP